MQEYTSSSEVLEAFRDIAKGHHSLYFDGQILHRDVSKDNIMISISPHGNGPRGFLIDLDVAQRLDKDEPKEGSRFGTRPFMAIGVLLAQRHTYKHDLESLFYCFLWTAICGKGNQWPPTDSKLWAWFRGSFKECALRKSRDMDVAGFEGVLEEFSEDFVPHKGLARSLWKLFFPHQGDLLVASRAEVSSDPFLLYRAVAEAFDQALL
jgi:serine/threonine protein kinase